MNKCVVNLFNDEKLKFENWSHGKYSGLSAEVASEWKAEKLGFHVEILNPGAFSCP